VTRVDDAHAHELPNERRVAAPAAAVPAAGGHSLRELRFDRVSRLYGEVPALSDFSLTVRGGEFVSFLGPSGSGKSTALNCLAGLVPPSSGEIWLDDRRIDTLSPDRRGFAMVFQNYALFPHMTVLRNVAFGLRMRRVGQAETERRTRAALELVRLAHKADQRPSQLSGGEQQRVAIARAIACEPPLVLMDEPLSNLDAKLRMEMRTEIRRIHQEFGLTTIYVTHDQQEALSLSDRLVILNHGVIEQVDTPAKIYDEPRTSFVADFVGYRNMLEGDVQRADGRYLTIRAGQTELAGIAHDNSTSGRVRMRLRPDDVVLADSEEPGPNRMRLIVEVVEYAGREFMVQASTGDGHRFALLAPQAPELGSEIFVYVPPDRVRLYSSTPPEHRP
jgi:putative spermidine/putrescine transport system ATP-binding protein